MALKPASFALSLARGSDEDLCSLSSTGRVLSWTRVAEVLLGFERADVVGRPLISLAVAPEDVERFEDALRGALSTGRAACRLRLRGRDGALCEPPLPLRLARDSAAPDSLRVYVGRESQTRADPVVPTLVPQTNSSDGPTAPRAELTEEMHLALAASFDPESMARRIVRFLVPVVADWCAIDLAAPTGTLRRVAVAHRDPSLHPLLLRLGDDGASSTVASAALVHRRVAPLTEAEAPLPPAAPDEETRLRFLRQVGLASYVVLPLVGRLRPAGTITLAIAHSGRAFSQDDVAWLRELSRRIALEMENARLADVVQRSREEARLANERANLLQGLAASISEALTPREVTQVVVEHCRKAIGASGGAIAVLREASFEIVGNAGPSEALSNAWRHFPIHARYPLSDAGRSGELVLVEHLSTAATRYPHLAGATPGVGALAAVALMVDGRRRGALGLTFPNRREFTEADVAFLKTIARVTADALERARLYDAERSARAEASVEAARSGLLAEASRMLAASFDYEATLQDVARLLVPTIADWCAIHVLERNQRLRTAAVVHADPSLAHVAARLRATPPTAVDRHLAKVLETQQPQIFHNIPPEALGSFMAQAERLEIVREMGLRSQMVLPLSSRGRMLGVMVLTHRSIRRFHATDLELAEELARRIAMGLDNARLFHDAQESEERYRLLVEGVQDHAFIMLDTAGRVASWNAGARRLLGYEAREAIGLDLARLYAEEDQRAREPANHIDAARREGRHEEEGWRGRRDGTAFFAYSSLTALTDDSGGLRGFSMLLRDLTEQRRAREALDHLRQQVVLSEKLSTMGTLVSGVAHEIRTPLTAMANSLHGLKFRLDSLKGKKMEAELHATLHARLDAAFEGIDRINRLVEDLRKFHRLPSTSRAVTGLHEVVSEALNLFQVAHRGRVEIAARLDPTPPCDVDRVQVQQAVLNLLLNASEAMPHGGKVVLETRREGNQALIVIQDHGEGMPPEVRARMFEEFFTTKPDGTGLGLSIVRRIVERHGASIDCHSEPGRGTRFYLRFPSAPVGAIV